MLILGAVIALGITYYGPLQTLKKENKELQKDIKAVQQDLTRSQQDVSTVRARNEELHRENLYYKEILDPIQKKANQMYPELETSAALSRLAKNINKVFNLATRDIYRPLDQDLRAKIVSDLEKVAGRFGPFFVKVVTNYQYGTTNRKELADEIVSVLQSAGISAKTEVLIILYARKPPSIQVQVNPEDVELSESF